MSPSYSLLSQLGSVEVWKCGSVEVWKCGSLEICKLAYLQISQSSTILDFELHIKIRLGMHQN